jgi:hypothetical protein
MVVWEVMVSLVSVIQQFHWRTEARSYSKTISCKRITIGWQSDRNLGRPMNSFCCHQVSIDWQAINARFWAKEQYKAISRATRPSST